jgi:uncharacterized protein
MRPNSPMSLRISFTTLLLVLALFMMTLSLGATTPTSSTSGMTPPFGQTRTGRAQDSLQGGSTRTGPSLTVILNLFDGTRRPLADSVPVHIELENPYEGPIANRDATGPTHKFGGLPWHGNAAAKVFVSVTAKGYFPVKHELPEVIRDDVQNANLMLIPERNETRAYDWQALSACCPNLTSFFSQDTTSASEAETRYRALALNTPDILANVLSVMKLLEILSLLGDVRALDFESKMTSSSFTIWADANTERWSQTDSNSRWFKFGHGRANPWDRNTVEEYYFLKWRIDPSRQNRQVGGTNCVAVVLETKPFSLKQYVRMWETNRGFDPPYSIENRNQPTFFEAAIDGNVEALKTFLATGSDVEAEDSDHLTALELAIQNKREKAVAYLLTAKANPNHHAPMVLAAEVGSVSILQVLLAGGAEINQKKSGRTAFLAACERGNLEVVEFLLDHGAHAIDKTDAGKPALEFAVNSGKSEVVRTLLSHGANPNATGLEGSSMLVISILANNIECVEALLQAGAEANAEQGLPLLTATAKGYANIVMSLLKHDADPNLRRYEAPLLSAAAGGYTEIVRMLVEHGANPNAGSEDGYTPLIAASFYGHAEIVSLLLSKGANVNAKDNRWGTTALIQAALEGTPEVVQALIAKGADTSLRFNGKTALELANQGGNREAAAVLKNASSHQFVLQRDFTYSEVGKNPNALRRELLESFLFSDLALLEHEVPSGEKLALTDSTKANLKAELNFMLQSLLKLYSKNRKQIAKYLNSDPARQLSASVELRDDGSAYAGSFPSADKSQPGSLYIDVKLLKANIAASSAGAFTLPAANSDLDRYRQVREIQRQVRNHRGINIQIDPTGPGGFRVPLSNPSELANIFDQITAYTELLDLDRQVKTAETQYYGTLLFILAHELGHLALGHHQMIEASPNDCDLRKRVELEADQFSALLLGTSFIALSVPVLPIEMEGLGKRNWRFLYSETLQRYVGYSVFFGKAYERLDLKNPQSNECPYPPSEIRLQKAALAVKSIEATEGDAIVNKLQRRQDLKDAVRSAFPRRYGLVSDILR